MKRTDFIIFKDDLKFRLGKMTAELAEVVEKSVTSEIKVSDVLYDDMNGYYICVKYDGRWKVTASFDKDFDYTPDNYWLVYDYAGDIAGDFVDFLYDEDLFEYDIEENC